MSQPDHMSNPRRYRVTDKRFYRESPQEAAKRRFRMGDLYRGLGASVEVAPNDPDTIYVTWPDRETAEVGSARGRHRLRDIFDSQRGRE